MSFKPVLPGNLVQVPAAGGGSLPSGGTKGNQIIKNSSTAGDASWRSNVFIDARDYGVDLTGATSSTAALNTALAAAFAAQAPLYLPNGHYKVDGSSWDATTNSLLTVAATNGYVGGPPIIAVFGESRGVYNFTTGTYVSGVVLDATSATGASGSFPAVFSASAFATLGSFDPTKWYEVEPYFKDLTIVVPANPTFGGLNFHNAMQAQTKRLFIAAAYSAGSPVVATHTAAVGIIFPGVGNSVKLSSTDDLVAGFFDGVWTGEHLRMRGLYSALNQNGLRIWPGHTCFGDIDIEQCGTMVLVDPSSATAFVNLKLEGEINTSGLYTVPSTGGGFVDANYVCAGKIEAEVYFSASASYGQIPLVAGPNLTLLDITNPRPSLPAPVGLWRFNGDLTDATGVNNLSDHGTITFVAGKLVSAASFNGSSQYATNASLNPCTGDFTICGWFNAGSLQTAVIASQFGHTAGTDQQWALVLISDSSLLFEIIGTGVTLAATLPTGSYAAGTWYFLAVSFNSTAKTYVMSINNREPGFGSFTGTLTPNNGVAFTFGADFDSGGLAPVNLFSGKLDAWRLYSSQLSVSQLEVIYDLGRGTESA